MTRRNSRKVEGEYTMKGMKKQKVTLVVIFASAMFVLLSGFAFVQTLDDMWRAGDIYLEMRRKGRQVTRQNSHHGILLGKILNWSMQKIQK